MATSKQPKQNKKKKKKCKCIHSNTPPKNKLKWDLPMAPNTEKKPHIQHPTHRQKLWFEMRKLLSNTRNITTWHPTHWQKINFWYEKEISPDAATKKAGKKEISDICRSFDQHESLQRKLQKKIDPTFQDGRHFFLETEALFHEEEEAARNTKRLFVFHNPCTSPIPISSSYPPQIKSTFSFSWYFISIVSAGVFLSIFTFLF